MKKKSYKISIILMVFGIILLNLFTVYADDELSIKAKAALIVEKNTGKIIYEKDINEQNYPASTTKILTAILTIENCDLEETATVSQNAISKVPTSYVVAPLYVGEEMKVKDLLYALMLKSSNDAAYVLAEHVGGSVDGFAEMMNNKAKEIGCKNTHFVNPNGIDNKNHYTTAYDMYLITNYAMKNETFAKIVSTYQYTLPATNKHSASDRIMKNTNNFVNPNSEYYDKKVKGVKTGTTDLAGNCLITDSADNRLEFITVVLGAETSNSKFNESSKMIEYAFNNYTVSDLHKKGDVIKNVEVKNATDETKNLNLVISDDIAVMNNVSVKVNEIEPEIVLNDNIVAPISKGQELGTIKYNVDGLEYNAKLLAESDVEVKTYYVQIGIGVGVFVVVLMILVTVRKKSRR